MMKAAFDGTIVFEQLELTVGGWEREAVEKSAAGLDGVVSVDLGRRTRRILQKGVLRAFSDKGLKGMVDEIGMLMDGACHVLVVADGGYYDRLRIDSVQTGRKVYSGRGVSCEFQMLCRQLGG